MTHAEAIDIIQNGGSSVKLFVKRTGKLPPSFGKNCVLNIDLLSISIILQVINIIFVKLQIF